YTTYANQFGYTSNGVPLTIGWARDTRDSALVPNSGRYQRINGEWGVGGDTRYLSASYQFQQYWPLSKQYTFAFNADFAYGKGLSGRPFPLFKNFYGGGLGSVRGFEQGSLGEVEVTNGGSLGGNKKVNLNFEIITPFPGAGNDRTLRMFSFLDVGNVFGESQPMRLNELRASLGVGISWISPVGPLRLALAYPIRKFTNDKIQRVQFQIGTSF
ncbi:MAG: BamA/TamA family outer membrane protein, partial [Rhodoferax sp.]|nr:BamA/TamA family outer membrane protein [Rhodoferax sp.]